MGGDADVSRVLGGNAHRIGSRRGIGGGATGAGHRIRRRRVAITAITAIIRLLPATVVHARFVRAAVAAIASPTSAGGGVIAADKTRDQKGRCRPNGHMS